MDRPRVARAHADGSAPTRAPSAPRTVVALGASAGGLESIGRVLAGLPARFNAPVLVALHLDPHHPSQAAALLQQRTALRVRVARTGDPLRAGTVYIAPPDRHLEVRGGRVRLSRAARVSYSRPSVDVLFGSVAATFGAAAIVAVLSGTGSDGAAGVAAVKARGGLAVAEDAATAAFPGMPAAAARTGNLDAVLPIDQVAPFLARMATRRVPVSQRQWARVLATLEARSGARFERYRSTTLQRRLQQRLAARGCRTMAAYLRLLASDRDEADRLQAAFLIKVSSFRRDPASWRRLEKDVPSLARGAADVRVWSAGCATGEEAYGLALLLARAFGTGPAARWKVFATDLDAGALRLARAGRYPDEAVRTLPARDLREHFVRDGLGWRAGKALRARVVFGLHDLLHDPPLPAIDLVACRNVLIYFTPPEKERALRRLTLAVRPGGLLFLGSSEALRPLPGYDRVGDTTYFRQRGVEQRMASPGRGAARDHPGKDAHKPGPRGRPSRYPTDARFLAQQDLNEELQSRNEELETVNEELQSLNDELSTMEEQMRGLSEESRRANDFLRVLLNTSSDVLVSCDGDDRVTFWNKAAIKRFRLSPAQAVGGKLFDLVPELDSPAVRAALRKVRQPGRSAQARVALGPDALLVDALPAAAGKRRGILLRVRSA